MSGKCACMALCIAAAVTAAADVSEAVKKSGTHPRVLPQTIVCSQTQFYPWREPARGYLGRYPNQPLFVDPDLPDDPDRTDIPEYPNWGNFHSQADYDITLREAKAMGIDGVAIFAARRGRFFSAGEVSQVEGPYILPIIFPRGGTPESFVKTLAKFVDNKRLYRHGGKMLVPSYWSSKGATPEQLKAMHDAARAAYGDRFIFLASMPILAKEWVRYELAGRRLSDKGRMELEDVTRAYARVSDGIQISEAHMLAKIEDGEKAFATEYWDEIHGIVAKVLAEPEFGGGKLLASAAVVGHVNTYQHGPTVAECCTRTLRESMEVAIKYNADYINLPEFDEFNENTCFEPTLYGSFAVRRIMRYYMDRIRGRALAPQAGDDVSKPNLVVSYRKALSPGELLAVEVLNVPDGSRSGPLEVAVELADENGVTLRKFAPRTVDEGDLAALRFDADTAELAPRCRAVQVRLAWRKDGKSERILEGFHPVGLCPGDEWCHICCKQPIRDLAPLSKAEVSFDGKRMKADFAAESGRIRYAMLCGNDWIQAIRGREGHPADLFREDDGHAVFQIIAQRFNKDVAPRGRKGKWCTFSVPGVPEAEWLFAKRYDKGETFNFPSHRGDGKAGAYYVRIPKSKLKGAVLKADFPGAWSGEIDLEKAYELGACAVGESVDVMQLTAARFALQGRYPSAADAARVSFDFATAADRGTMAYHAQVVTMDGKTWFSRPFVLEKASAPGRIRVWDAAKKSVEEVELPSARIPDISWDFSPKAGQVALAENGEMHWNGMLGGFPTPATLWNRGCLTEGYSGWGSKRLAKDRATDTSRNGTPKRIQEPDGSWSLEFDGCDDFVALPWTVIPAFSGFTIELDVMPYERGDGAHGGIVGAVDSLNELGIDANGELTLDYGEMLRRNARKTGLRLRHGEWSHLRVVCTGDELLVSADGKEMKTPLKVKLPGEGTGAAWLGGYERSVWNFGFFKGRIRNLHISHGVKSASPVLAAEVPQWNAQQAEFLGMPAAERRAKFTDADWRKSILFGADGPWRKANPGESCRFVHLGGVPNMRDFGGLRTLDGRSFKKGLLYRSAGLNNNAPYRLVTNDVGKTEREYYGKGGERLLPGAREYATKTLGIKTDLDLRGPGECKGMTGSPLGPEVKWIRVTFHGYASLFRKGGKEAFRQAFAALLDESNYPLVFHCIAGADRTGTLAYVVEALCGVSDDDMLFDWELTALANANVGFSHEKRYDRLVAGFLNYPGSTTAERVAAFVKEQGFTDDDINRLKAFLLE